MVLIMIEYYHCWISYPTYDIEERPRRGVSNIYRHKYWKRVKTVRLAGHDTKLLDFD